jgi:hypothetical protein
VIDRAGVTQNRCKDVARAPLICADTYGGEEAFEIGDRIVPAKRHRFAARRKAAGFSQEQLAERLSVDRSTVARRVGELDAPIELYSVTQFGRIAGSCYLFLADTRRAQGLLEATAAAHSDHSKSQAIVLGNLALTLIRQGDLDEAAGRLHEAIDVIALNRGGGGLNIVFSAGREMRPWRAVPVVQDVYDRLLSLMAG